MKEVLDKIKTLFFSEKEFSQSSFSFGFNKDVLKTTLVSIAFGLLLALVIYPVLAVNPNQVFWGLPYETWTYIYMFFVPSLMALLVAFYIDDTAFALKIECILYALITIGILVWFAYSFVLMGDEREHLTASFYIYSGQRPYIDFFEHHHPLLWYLFLPIIWLFHNTGAIWYIMRSYTLLLVCINAIVVYKITRLIAQNSKFSWFAVLFSICSHIVFVAQIIFRPDTLMSLLLLCGIYYMLKSLKEKRDVFMYIAFIFFFFSFMALQKALIFLFFIALLLLYLVYRKELSMIQILKSLILPIVLFCGYLLYLYKTGALKDYWELNWLLNIKARYLFVYMMTDTIWFWGANILAVFFLFTKQPLFIKYLSFLCICFSVALSFLATFVQYWIPLYSLFAIISSYAVCRLKDKIGVVVFAVIITSTIFNNREYFADEKKYLFLYEFVDLSNLVLKESSTNDLIIGNLPVLGGLRPDATGYYWFGRDYMAVIDNHYFNRHPLPDLNEILKDKNPKIVSDSQIPGCTNPDFTNTRYCNQIFEWDFDYLWKNYVKSGPLFIRRY